MANESLSEILKATAKVEGTYNAAIGTTAPAAATDDVLCIDSPVPVNYETKRVPIRPHSGSNTITTKDAITMWAIPVNFRFPLMGGTALGTATTNGLAGILALLRSCQCAVAATPSTKILITPQAVGSFESCAMRVEEHGELHALTGMYGNFSLVGDPDSEGVIVSYSGMSMFNTPTRAAMSGTYQPTDRSEMFLGATGGIHPRGGSKYDSANGMQLPMFSFDRGAPNPAKCKDAFSTSGLARLLPKRPEPKLTITMKYETGSANLTYNDLPSHLTARTDHGVEFMYGTNPAKIKFWFPTAQLLTFRPQVYENYRTVTCEYLLRSSSNEGEFLMELGNPSLDATYYV